MITLDGIVQTLALDPAYATTKISKGSMHSDMIYIYILGHCVHEYRHQRHKIHLIGNGNADRIFDDTLTYDWSLRARHDLMDCIHTAALLKLDGKKTESKPTIYPNIVPTKT